MDSWSSIHPVCMDAGPDAPLVLERGLTACHMEHVYDFYKPAGFFPKVTPTHKLGTRTPACYLLDKTCYVATPEQVWVCPPYNLL